MKYIMEFGSIVILYIAVINLNAFRFKAKDIILMIVSAELLTAMLLNTNEFITVIPMIIIPAIFIYKNSKNAVRSVSIPIISLIITVLTDYIVSNISLSFFGINPDLARTNIKLYWFMFLIMLVFVFLITRFLGLLLNKKFNIAAVEFKGKFGALIVLSMLLTIIIFYTNIIFESDRKIGSDIIRINGFLFFSYFILLKIIIYILINGITKEMQLRNKQLQFESLQEYTANLEKLYSDVRAFRHDYINILSSMIGYIQNSDIEGLQKHFNEKIIPLSKGMESNNFKIGLLKNIKIPEVKGIFSSKLIRAQELGIDTSIEIVEPIENISMDIIDLSRCVGILLDNAIEAAEKCDKPSMKVALINKDRSVLIIIINSCSEEIPIFKIYQKGFSTKGLNRGLGLSNLKQIIGKYTNVSLDTSIENGEFKQFIEIASI